MTSHLSSQATAEHYKGDLFNEYKLLLAAERWTDAHKIAVYELAPEAIIRSDPTLLRRLFEPFEPSQVADWEEGAQVSHVFGANLCALTCRRCQHR